jgi:hypothetical protein
MKHGNQIFGYAVLLGGLALIFAGFFLFVPEDKRNDIFWLDLGVVCLVFLVLTLTELGLFGIDFDFEKQVAGLGIRLAYIRLYSILSVAVIIFGYFGETGFRYQLFYQLMAVFILFLGYFFSHFSSSKAVSVQAEQDMQRKGKDEISRALNQLEILFTGNSANWQEEKQKINLLKDSVRYLSPSNNKSATDLDSEIANTIHEAYAIAKNKNEGGIEVLSLLKKCEGLLNLRKATYSN